MKKPIVLASIILLSGCATYKFHHGTAPYDKGYVVSRDDYTIIEYTVGKENAVPKLKLAKERFKRRSNIVEDYYKRMGYIQNHFTVFTWEPAISFLKIIGGVFRLPFVAVSDYRYEHNPKYREKIKKLEAKQDLREENRIKVLKEKLNLYIQKDLAQEEPYQETQPEKIVQETPKIPEKEVQIAKLSEAPVEEKPKLPEPKVEILPQETKPEPLNLPQVAEEQKAIMETEKEAAIEVPKVSKEESKKPSKPPVAVIIAKPTKGLSPLRVRCYGNKSRAPAGRIIHYAWDFGDGDTSTKMNPINTYYSASFEPRYYTVALTVHDDKGNSATTSTTIEVINN